MKDQIKLNPTIYIDKKKLIESRMVILANSGGGKSYAIRKFAEGAVADTQTIIIDPEGEFASLREKYDFILAGKNADVPAEVRSAGLLATRLLELGKSAIIDLYELHPQDRQRFVKLFFESMLNAPKELYHEVFIILDEAHEFAPEGKPSEATWSVEAMASRGRKRGFCLIPASQRISKLSKNVSAECNNKLIGRASQDIDMKRAGDELGFNKESMIQLRQLKPGEFFAFGPAISDEVKKIKIGEVKTSHAKVSYGKSKVPPPSAVIKKILSEIKDLPQEAEQEAKTVAELKKENKDLKQMNINLLKHPFQKDETYEQGREEGIALMKKAVQEVEKKMNDEFAKERKEILEQIKGIFSTLGKINPEWEILSYKINPLPPLKNLSKEKIPEHTTHPGHVIKDIDNFEFPKPLSKGALTILSYLESVYPDTKTKTQIWVATGYFPGGGFNNLIYELTGKGLITKSDNGFTACKISGESFDASLSKWESKLSKGAWKIFQFLMETPNEAQSKSIIAEQTGYRQGGGFNNLIYELSGKELIKKSNQGYIINSEILDL